jgi:hypothetical protein
VFRKGGSHPTAGLDLVSKIRSDIDAEMCTAVTIMFFEKGGLLILWREYGFLKKLAECRQDAQS